MNAENMKISEVFHEAADHYLWDGLSKDWWLSPDKEEYSCHALRRACGGEMPDAIRIGLTRLGLNPQRYYAFHEFEEGEERQAVRYAWLKFCALLAEEQGV